jgi:hypothetical protein
MQKCMLLCLIYLVLINSCENASISLVIAPLGSYKQKGCILASFCWINTLSADKNCTFASFTTPRRCRSSLICSSSSPRRCSSSLVCSSNSLRRCSDPLVCSSNSPRRCSSSSEMFSNSSEMFRGSSGWEARKLLRLSIEMFRCHHGLVFKGSLDWKFSEVLTIGMF